MLTSGDGGSWSIRMSDVAAAFSTWRAYPFFGAGFYNLNEVYSRYTVTRKNGTPTMGLLNILAFGGIYMFVGYVVAGMRYYVKARKTKSKTTVYTFLLLMVAFLCTSANQYSYSLILFLALGWSIRGNKFEISR
jgi:hypothetical protein